MVGKVRSALSEKPTRTCFSLRSVRSDRTDVPSTSSERSWRYLVRRAAAAAVLAAAALSIATGASDASGQLPGILSYWTGTFVVRPPWIDLTPTDGETITGAHGTFQHPSPIKWVSWTQSEARGVGVLWVDTCKISCAQGPQLRYPAAIRGFARQGGHFTLLTIDSHYGHSPMQFRMVVQPGFGGKFVPVSG